MHGNPRPSAAIPTLWPHAIVTVFGIFIIAAAIFITWALGQKVDLVSADYYEQEILFQQRIDAVARTRALADPARVACQPNARQVTVTLPRDHAQAEPSGAIKLYRPSNARMDHVTSLRLDATGSQYVSVEGLEPGHWKVQVSWAVHGHDYYLEQPIMVGAER